MIKRMKYFITFFFFGFLIFGMWEWIQTPFFTDITDEINIIVWYRVHCTIGDIMIMGFSILFWSLIKRSNTWFFAPRGRDYLAVTIMGTAYTAYSEILNVVVRRSWAYSELMPMIPGTHIGIVPIVQWLALPSIILYICARFTRGR
ncbi:hypothetical protein PM10SUCC1_35870 [Propionigenium maris DSM 9537]|uniref:Uncharacterized protein n=1 Tax=Propionigenium maris DSM 9537 TaxID=1123000 RepID=A0A9W6GN15_9FUSO|nr:hypothetical protein [Propionigenium maris]GLI58073.1 hypothetical protein PM10SUCC1_35870 [Propionigenium maris DSM 9537]